jgi:anti-anti-sigma factor
MEDGFDVRRTPDGVWHVAGELDMATAPTLLEAVRGDGAGSDGLRFSLADLTFIDSQGLRAFIELADGLAEDAQLVLADVRPEVRRVFEVVQLGSAPRITLEE